MIRQHKYGKPTIFAKTILIVNYLVSFALLVCYLAPFINAANCWPVAFFSMAYLPILGINVVFFIGWLPRYRMLALISGICILIGCVLIPHAIGFRSDNYPLHKASRANIRVMTYNVYDFLNHDLNKNVNTNSQVLHIIDQQQPDVVNMQEYFTHNSDKAAMAHAVATQMSTPYYWFKALKITPYDSTGLAIFSKYPIINHDTIPVINGIATEGIFVDVKKDDKIFRIYCVHLQSTQFDRSENAYLDKLSNNGEPDVRQSHNIFSKLKWAFIRRGEQVIGLKEELNKCPYPYIITGDFNDTPLSFAVNHIAKGLKNAFLEKGSGLGVTYYGQFPGFQLDYVMVSPQFDVLNYHIVEQQLSDHYPVITDLELN